MRERLQEKRPRLGPLGVMEKNNKEEGAGCLCGNLKFDTDEDDNLSEVDISTDEPEASGRDLGRVGPPGRGSMTTMV